MAEIRSPFWTLRSLFAQSALYVLELSPSSLIFLKKIPQSFGTDDGSSEYFLNISSTYVAFAPCKKEVLSKIWFDGDFGIQLNYIIELAFQYFK